MMVSGLEYLDEPAELESVAMLFSGGMGLGGHCGFLTAGLMLLGLAAAGSPNGKAAASEARKEFTDAWKKRWPFLCKEIKTAPPEKKMPNCGVIGVEAGSILGPLLEPLAKDPQRARFQRKPRT